MKDRILGYLQQRSTWLGIGSAIVVLVNITQPDYTAIVAGILAAAGLIVTDKGPVK